MTDIMQVDGLTFRHNDKKRWLKKPEIFELGPIDLTVQPLRLLVKTAQVSHC